MTDSTPHERLYVQDVDNWEAEARAFAEKLIQEGKPPRFEVFYPTPETALKNGMTDEEWQDRQANLNGVGTYDIIELVNGAFVAVPRKGV